MERNDCIIRPEKKEEYREVEALVREAFWNVYRPGCSEHCILHQLRNDRAFVPELDLVMERGGRIIGQITFIRAGIQADDGREIPVLTIGPICVAPACKKQGYGKKLLDHSLERAAELGCGAVFLEGNIDFYGKSGFTAAGGFGIRQRGLPADADPSFLLCRELIPGYLNGAAGEYITPPGYFVSDDQVEAFDRTFPPREKRRLPGQLF